MQGDTTVGGRRTLADWWSLPASSRGQCPDRESKGHWKSKTNGLNSKYRSRKPNKLGHTEIAGDKNKSKSK